MRNRPSLESGDSIRDCDQIEFGMTAGLNVNQPALKFKMTLQQAAPEVERLADVCQIAGRRQRAVGFLQFKSNLAQVKAVWVFAQPVEKWFLSLRIRRVTDGPAISIVVFVAKIFRVKPGGQGRAVPGPMRRGAKRKLTSRIR